MAKVSVHRWGESHEQRQLHAFLRLSFDQRAHDACRAPFELQFRIDAELELVDEFREESGKLEDSEAPA